MVRVVWISLQTWSHPNEPLMQVHQCKMYTQFFFFFLMRAMKQKLFQFFKSHFCDIFQIFYPNFISGTDDDLMITATMMTMVYLQEILPTTRLPKWINQRPLVLEIPPISIGFTASVQFAKAGAILLRNIQHKIMLRLFLSSLIG